VRKSSKVLSRISGEKEYGETALIGRTARIMNQLGFCEVTLRNGQVSGWHIRKMFSPDGERIPTTGLIPKSLCGHPVWRDRDASDQMTAYNLFWHGCYHCQVQLGYPL
jgi:hypothetical protein